MCEIYFICEKEYQKKCKLKEGRVGCLHRESEMCTCHNPKAIIAALKAELKKFNI